MRLFAITIIPHHRCAMLSLLILFKTTRPRAYLLPHWKLLYNLISYFFKILSLECMTMNFRVYVLLKVFQGMLR